MNFKEYDEFIKNHKANLCDVAVLHKNDIINNEFTKWDLLGVCYEQ